MSWQLTGRGLVKGTQDFTTVILETQKRKPMVRFYNWITSTETHLYIRWVVVSMIPTLLTTTYVFVIAFIAVSQVDFKNFKLY